MLTRRNLLWSSCAAAAYPVIALAETCGSELSKDGQHSILMLNAACGDAQQTNVFEPPILFAQPGDTVTFLPTDAGHNTASKRGMIPDGAEPWNSSLDVAHTIELTVPGIYGYICVPHYEMGMVGLIVVGDAVNYESARRVRHPGKARQVFRDLLAEVEQPA